MPRKVKKKMKNYRFIVEKMNIERDFWEVIDCEGEKGESSLSKTIAEKMAAYLNEKYS